MSESCRVEKKGALFFLTFFDLPYGTVEKPDETEMALSLSFPINL